MEAALCVAEGRPYVGVGIRISSPDCEASRRVGRRRAGAWAKCSRAALICARSNPFGAVERALGLATERSSRLRLDDSNSTLNGPEGPSRGAGSGQPGRPGRGS
jgi:hypothetical protein